MRFNNKPQPAKPEDLKKWEEYFGVVMPTQLRKLLVKTDGPILYRDDTQKELQFLGAADSIDSYEAYGFDRYLPDCIPVSLDGGGIFAVYRVRENSVSGIWAVSAGALDWNEATYLCNDLHALIELEYSIDSHINKQDSPAKTDNL